MKLPQNWKGSVETVYRSNMYLFSILKSCVSLNCDIPKQINLGFKLCVILYDQNTGNCFEKKTKTYSTTVSN